MRAGLGVGMAIALGAGEAAGGGGGYTPEAEALFLRMTPEPNETRKGVINDCIEALLAAGVWTKLDALYVMAAHDAQAAGLNWIADAYNLSPQNSPAFETDRGYTGNGSSSYLSTGFNPTTEAATAKYVQNSAHVSLWSRTAASGSGNDFGCPAGQVLRGIARTTSEGMVCAINSANSGIGNGNTSTPGDTTSGLGHFLFNRSGGSAVEFYQNGAAKTLSAAAKASSAIPNANIDIARGAGSFSARQFAATTIGQSLNSTEAGALYDALAAYMTAVGA